MRGRPDQEARTPRVRVGARSWLVGHPGAKFFAPSRSRAIHPGPGRRADPPPRRGRATRLRPLPAAPTHPTQAWAMEGAAPDGNRGPNGGRPRRCAPLPPPAAAPGPPFPQALAKRLPAPRRARPPPPTLAVSHTSHSPGDDESYTLLRKNIPRWGGSLSWTCPGSVDSRRFGSSFFCWGRKPPAPRSYGNA